MKKWTQVVLTAAAVTTALVVGLSAASVAGASAVPQATGANHDLSSQVVVDPQTSPEAVFQRVAPCRIVDTRVAGGPFGKGTTRTYFVGGTSGFSEQGGKPGGCGIPLAATAVAAVITAVTPTRQGTLRAYAAGTVAPNSSVLNYPAGITTGSGVTLPLSAGAWRSLSINNFTGATQLIVDVQGFYAPQIQALIGGDGTISAGTSRVVSVSHPGTGFYYITLDRPARQCSPSVTTFNLDRYAAAGLASSTQPNVISVSTWFLNSTSHLETPTDYPFFLTVTC